jgi:hypothetical protein
MKEEVGVSLLPCSLADMGPLFSFRAPYFGIGVFLAVFFLGLWISRFFRSTVGDFAARQAFHDHRRDLESQFFHAAAASGKPRGLRWKACEWDDRVEFVREKQTGHLAALVGVTIQFEAIEGSGMEGLPAVGNLRNASAVFFYHRGRWHTTGKAVFNLNPGEALAHFATQYERLPT